MSPADRVLGALAGVRRTGPGRWSAICPAHADRRPSLSIRELDDGMLLAHCHAGCSVDEVVGALGLQLADLYRPRRDRSPGVGAPRERRPWSAADLLRCAAFEATVVVVVVADLLAGRPADRERLLQAAQVMTGLVGVIDG